MICKWGGVIAKLYLDSLDVDFNGLILNFQHY